MLWQICHMHLWMYMRYIWSTMDDSEGYGWKSFPGLASRKLLSGRNIKKKPEVNFKMEIFGEVWLVAHSNAVLTAAIITVVLLILFLMQFKVNDELTYFLWTLPYFSYPLGHSHRVVYSLRSSSVTWICQYQYWTSPLRIIMIFYP